MAFPATPLAVTVELLLGGVWTNITTYTLLRSGGITITRGRADEGDRVDAGKCAMQINNANGRFSPRNPTGPYYGLIGRNTQIRVTVEGSVRFVGEVSAWPTEWELDGSDVWTEVEASGILRRLGQGASALQSTLRRVLTAPSAVAAVAYWPCEDPAGATELASAVGGPAMGITGTPTLAEYESFAASAPLPVLADAMLRGVVPAYTVTAETQVYWLMAVPAGGAIAGQPIIRLACTGTAPRWELVYGTGGTLNLSSYDADGTLLQSSGAIAFAVDGKLLRVGIELVQDGADVDWRIVSQPVGGTATQSSGTLTGRTVGRVITVRVAPDRGLTSTAIGHIAVHNDIIDVYDISSGLKAYDGEGATSRILRLCTEEGITASVTGAGSPLGVQGRDTLLDLISNAAAADAGVLYELRTSLGLGYRSRTSRYNQAVDLALDYAAGHISPPLRPMPDDQNVRNDIVVQRAGGSSARVTRTSGPLSTAAPPNGVGLYDEQLTLTLHGDHQAEPHAGWRVHLGTWDEDRYPQVSVNLARNPSLMASVVALDSGDRVTITGLPAWLPPGLADLIVQGYTEKFTSFTWDWTANCTPAKPYDVAVYDTARYSSAGSTLAEDLTTTETGVDVTTSSGPLWTTAAGEMPFDIIVGGEVMRVTAISGSSSPQTFTVTRSINGVVKTHSTGAAVALATPAVRAL